MSILDNIEKSRVDVRESTENFSEDVFISGYSGEIGRLFPTDKKIFCVILTINSEFIYYTIKKNASMIMQMIQSNCSVLWTSPMYGNVEDEDDRNGKILFAIEAGVKSPYEGVRLIYSIMTAVGPMVNAITLIFNVPEKNEDNSAEALLLDDIFSRLQNDELLTKAFFRRFLEFLSGRPLKEGEYEKCVKRFFKFKTWLRL